MTRITIIPADKTVYVDSIYRELDLSSCGIPADVHALQWYDTRGWIEFVDSVDPFTPKQANQDIAELPAWANACVDAYNAWVPPAPPVFVPNTDQPGTTGTQTL